MKKTMFLKRTIAALLCMVIVCSMPLLAVANTLSTMAQSATLLGDVNSDGDVNNKDFGVLQRFINGWDVAVDSLAADVNSDGGINNKDLGIVERHLNGWDTVIGEQIAASTTTTTKPTTTTTTIKPTTTTTKPTTTTTKPTTTTTKKTTTTTTKATTTTTTTSSSDDESTVVMKGNLAAGHKYQLSYPGLQGFSGDVNGTLLTDGAVNKNTIGEAGWLKATINSEVYARNVSGVGIVEMPTYNDVRTPGYTVTLDLGYVCDVESVVVASGTRAALGISLPESVEVYLSNDGYNFTMYPAQTSSRRADGGVEYRTITFSDVQKAKAVRIKINTSIGKTTALAEIQVNGTRHQAKKLLSQGAAYEIRSDVSTTYPHVDGTLTDGITGNLTSTANYVGLKATLYDPRTSQYRAYIKVDLGAVRNVSEVEIEALCRTGIGVEPKFIVAYYSANNIEYEDFGTAMVTSTYGEAVDKCKSLFTITRNHTVKARYLMVGIYGMASGTEALVDELRVYGCDEVVDEPIYDHVTKEETLSYTNIVAGKTAKVDSSNKTILTDSIYTNDTSTMVVSKSSGTTTIEIPFGQTYAKINGVAMYFRTNSTYKLPGTAQIYLVNGSTSTEITAEMLTSEQTGNTVARWLFDDTVATGIKIVLNSTSAYRLAEVSVYNEQSQLPTVDGGFINPNFQTVTKNEGIGHLDDYMWYMLLKGMKDLGMDYAIVPYTTNKRLMKTLLRGNAELKALGYSELRIHSSGDPIESIMAAADKLNIKVFMGTVLGTAYEDIPAAEVTAYHNEIIAEAKITMDALQSQYGHHESFYGFYFSDETSDEWLKNGAVSDFRRLYKAQSDYARSIAPEKKTMICPAMWGAIWPGACSAANGASCVYELVRPEQAGGRPIVDIVAPQDCLGREKLLKLADTAFTKHEPYVEAWANSVRSAGAEFWNDLEAFNGYYMSKNNNDLISALEIQSKYTGTNIIFDIVNYFSPLCQGGRLSDVYRGIYSWEYTQQDYAWMQYVKYYQTRYAEANRKGATLSGSGIVQVATPPTLGQAISSDQWGAFKQFESSSVEYAMSYDSDNLYLAFKTNDTTPVTGTLANWYNTKADMIQIFLTGKGDRVNDATGLTALSNSLRLAFVRTATDVFSCKVAATGTSSGGSGIRCEAVTVNGKSEMIIAIPWQSALGMTAPSSGASVGLKMIYYDVNTDGTKVNTSNTGEMTQQVGSKALYTVG